MFDPRYPWLAILALTLAATGALLYRAAIVSGLYKDPIMARLRMYGTPRRYYPLCRFLDMLGWWSLMVASLLDALDTSHPAARLYAPVTALALMVMAWGGSMLVRHTDGLHHALPPWYAYLMHAATRQERRRIAHAWRRIPRMMRLRLNGDQHAFRVWADIVRITVIYGARDPDNPWDRQGND